MIVFSVLDSLVRSLKVYHSQDRLLLVNLANMIVVIPLKCAFFCCNFTILHAVSPGWIRQVLAEYEHSLRVEWMPSYYVMSRIYCKSNTLNRGTAQNFESLDSLDPLQHWGDLTYTQETWDLCLHWLDSSWSDSGCNSNYSVIWFEPYPHESCIDLAHFHSVMFTSHNQECLYRQLIYVSLSDVTDQIDEEWFIKWGGAESLTHFYWHGLIWWLC